MFIAIDIIIIVIMAATVIRAVKRGFVASLFGLVTLALSIVAAIMFYKELGIYINERFLFNAVEPHLVDFVENIIAENGGDLSAGALLSGMPDELRTIVEGAGINLDSTLSGVSEVPEQIANNLAASLSALISNIISFAVIFFGAYIALSLICLILNTVVKLPILKGINKFLGLVFGATEAFVLGLVIASLATAACGLYASISGDAAFANVLDKTVVAKALLSVCPW